MIIWEAITNHVIVGTRDPTLTQFCIMNDFDPQASLFFPQAQQDPLGNISMAEAATAASNARHWMQMQNAGRTSGDTNYILKMCACVQACTHMK